MRAPSMDGVLNFATGFAVGFVLGVLRGLAVARQVGELWAVALELPVMLGVSWWVCGLLVKRMRVPATAPARLLTGGVAFTQLMLAELCVSLLLLRRTPAELLAPYNRLSNLQGLFAQLQFALFPLSRRFEVSPPPR